MPKVHHFVHLWYTTENHWDYQSKVLGRIEDIWARIRKWANDIVVVVKDWERVDESLVDTNAFAIIELIANAIIYKNLQLRNKQLRILESLVESCSAKIILKDILKELSKHESILESKHIHYISPKGRLFHWEDEKEVAETIIKETNNGQDKWENEFIDDYVLWLYFQIFQKMFQKYKYRNLFNTNCWLERNNAFRDRVSQIMATIPPHHIFYNEMRWYDVPSEILDKNISFFESDLRLGRYYVHMKTTIGNYILDEYKKRLKKDFKWLKKEVIARWFEFNERQHVLWWEYTDCCVANYSWFLQYFLGLDWKRINIDSSISLPSHKFR